MPEQRRRPRTYAGFYCTTGSGNIYVGSLGAFPGESGTIRIGGTQTATYIAGINGSATGVPAVAVMVDANGKLGTIFSSRRYKFYISDMDRATDGLMSLRPVTFRYLANGDNAPLQFGLIAEEVAEVYPELVTRNKDGQMESVMCQFLAPMLLNEAQKQHRQIEEQQKQIEEQQKMIEELGQRLAALERRDIVKEPNCAER